MYEDFDIYFIKRTELTKKLFYLLVPFMINSIIYNKKDVKYKQNTVFGD